MSAARPEPYATSSPRIAATLALGVLVLAVAVVFAPIVGHELTLWDDSFNLWRNPRMNPPTLESLRYYWTHEAFGLYAPLTYSVWLLLARLAHLPEPNALGVQLDPAYFHAASLVLHVVNAAIVWALLRRMVRNDLAAAVGAAAFALHPVQVETVAWAAGLKDLLSSTLSLVALWLFVAGIEIGEGQSTRRRAVLAGATLSFLLALLAKPGAMVVPLIAFLLSVWGLERPARGTALRLLPWVGASLACAFVVRLTQSTHSVVPTPLWARPILAGDTLTFYAFKLVWPARLGIDYGWQPLGLLRTAWFYFLWMPSVALLAWLWRVRGSRPQVWAGAAIFVAVVFPVLGFVPFIFQSVSHVADHYLYLALLGPALALASVLARHPTRLVYAVAVAALVMLGIRSAAQVETWQSDVALFRHAIAVNPESHAAWYHLGYAQRLRGDLPGAERSLRTAIRQDPRAWEPRHHLASVLLDTGRPAESAMQMREAIAMRSQAPGYSAADSLDDRIGTGEAFLSAGRFDDAAEEFRTVLRFRPKDGPARFGLLRAETARAREAATRDSGSVGAEASNPAP
jgi:tetratricopeptide (TPR) repeat protein